MNFNAVKKALIALTLALVALPAAFAYHNSYYSNPSYFRYGEPRMGAYSAQFGYAQGFYDYASPPMVLSHYGAQYKIYNIRDAAYANSNYARVPNIYRPYYGYPYRSYGSQPWSRYDYYS